MRLRVSLVAGALLIAAASAYAQGPYVGASIGSDVTRFDTVSGQDAPGAGEAVSWALKVGAPVASRFGVELEFSRPQRVTQTDSGPIIYAATPLSAVAAAAGVPISNVILPSLGVRTSQRNTTIATTMWVRQEVTPRFSMVYLGGVGFFRTTREFAYDFPVGFASTAIASILPRSSTTIEYGAGPVAGVEARIGMTDHLQFVPGVRMQLLTGGWLVRPSAGIAWDF